jgi:hypothetical protein
MRERFLPRGLLGPLPLLFPSFPRPCAREIPFRLPSIAAVMTIALVAFRHPELVDQQGKLITTVTHEFAHGSRSGDSPADFHHLLNEPEGSFYIGKDEAIPACDDRLVGCADGGRCGHPGCG